MLHILVASPEGIFFGLIFMCFLGDILDIFGISMEIILGPIYLHIIYIYMNICWILSGLMQMKQLLPLESMIFLWSHERLKPNVVCDNRARITLCEKACVAAN